VLSAKISARQVGVDDWLILGAAILMTGELFGYIYSLHLGFGKQSDILEIETVIAVNKIYYFLEIIYLIIVCFVKYACLIGFLHLFGITRPARFYANTIIALVTCYFIAALFATIFQCNPIRRAWNPPTLQSAGSCVNLRNLYLDIGTPNIATDVGALILPVRYIWKLSTKPWKKVLICVIFLSGGIATISSIFRLWALLNLYYNSRNFTYIGTRPELWSFVETSVGIITACLPSSGLVMKTFKC